MLKFQDVSFKYEYDNTPIMEHFSIHVEDGDFGVHHRGQRLREKHDFQIDQRIGKTPKWTNPCG